MNAQEQARSRREAKRAMRQRVARGDVLPQECPLCKADLRDTSVPLNLRWAAGLFTRAIEWHTKSGTYVYQCPSCKGYFGEHKNPA